MTNPAALTPEDLEHLTGYSRQADIEKWCHRNGVRFFRARTGVCTTLDALNEALGVKPADAPARKRVNF